MKTGKKCPRCGALVEKPYKEWEATKNKPESEIKVMIHLWRCPKCGKVFRSATKTWRKHKRKSA